MNFDEIIERRGTDCAKWDSMQAVYGVSPDDGLAMWVADMDFRPPQAIQDALVGMTDHGVYGYWGPEDKYRDAIRWWMKTRHDWDVERDQIFTTHGLVNGTALCIDAYTQPGDGVVLMTPVYHAFARVIRASDRALVECELALQDGKYVLDIPTWDAQMTGNEKVLVLCSPHNPGGRVWTREELTQIADFAKRHDLILVSDEIHCDLVFDGYKHIPMALIDGVQDRLVMMTATTKTFNIAGTHTGNVIIPDPDLRARFAKRMGALGMSANSFGIVTTQAGYTPEGAAWVDALMTYLDGNRRLFDEGIAQIPGLASMELESTYLSWVDFAGTGMARDEFTARTQDVAKIAANHGPSFGKGGDSYLRFNLATPRARVVEAVERLQDAFKDLQ